MSSARRFALVTPLLALLSVLIPVHLADVAPPVAAAQAPEDRADVIIRFRNAPDTSDEGPIRNAGGRVKQRFRLVRAIAANVPRRALTALLANPRVAAVEPDVRIFALDAELDSVWGVVKIGAGTVHADGATGAGVKVAVIDTGIDTTHPDLAAGYGGGWDFVNNDGDPFDDNGHGTHVAGTIGARDDEAGVVGVAPGVTLYTLKVLDASGSGNFSSVMGALEWAVAHDVQITNSSFGAAQYPGSAVQEAFDNAAAGGMLHIAAAGNAGTCAGTGDNVQYPARFDSVVAVAATDQNDVSPCFSSTGPKVELAAPGVSINSTAPGGGYQVLSGTSMASPHAAGAAALVLGAGVTDTNGNGLVNDEVRAILGSTAHDLGGAGRDTWYGFGLIDVAAALGGTPAREASVAVAVATNKTTYTKGVDTLAQVTAVVTDENGAPVSGLTSAAFATQLDGVNVPATFAETTPGTYTGSVNISSAATGAHNVSVTTTDSRGLSGVGAASFTIVAQSTVKAKSITYSTYGGFNGKRNLVITVLVVDGANKPLANATVSILLNRNGGYYAAANGKSGTNGKAVFEASNAPGGCYQTVVAALLAGTRTWDGVTPANSYCK